jgi:hypothetical protein
LTILFEADSLLTKDQDCFIVFIVSILDILVTL